MRAMRLLSPGIAGRSQHAVPQWCPLEGCGVQQVQADVLDVVLHLLQLTQHYCPLLLDLGLVQREALRHFRQQLHGCMRTVMTFSPVCTMEDRPIINQKLPWIRLVIRLELVVLLSTHRRTFGEVFRKGLHVVRSVLSRGIGTQVSSHRLHLLLQSQLRVLLGSLVETSRK